jgi:hypothetical protein
LTDYKNDGFEIEILCKFVLSQTNVLKLFMRQILVIGLFFMLFLASCREKITKKALASGDKLRHSIENFEQNRSKLSMSVIGSLSLTEKKMATPKPDLPQVAKDWEKDWNDIQSRYNKMKSDFEEIGKSSDAYFKQLDDLSGSISDQALRASELGKNKTLHDSWSETYKEAAISVAKVNKVMAEGHDFHMVLVASSIRQKLEKNVIELKAISEQAKALLKELESFTVEGRKLVEG